jgi:ABC-type Na+ efflux pump permease subunit
MVGVIIALVIGGILVGYLLPVGIGAVNSPTNETFNQEEGVTYEVAGGQINSTVTTSSAGSTATIELVDTETGDTVSSTVNVGETLEYELSGGTVNVTVDSVNSGSPNTVEGTYEYQNYGWSDGAKSLYGLMPLFFVLVPLVVVVGWAMRSM